MPHLMNQTDRNRMGELLRQLASGRITNDQFEDGLDMDFDANTQPIFRAAWLFYDDLHTHRLKGTHRLTPLERQLFARCVLFLRSGRPYEWASEPRSRSGLDPTMETKWATPCRRSVHAIIARMFTSRRCDDDRNDGEAKSRMIDDRIWPFRRRADLNAALRNPPYLAGCSV